METINPYLFAIYLILKRVIWDLNYKSWVSRYRIKTQKNKYLGKSAVILCNGPSLNKVNFELLKESGVYTFGLNKINLLFDRTDFRPNCIVAINPFVIKQNKEFYNSTNIPLYLNSICSHEIKNRKNVSFTHSTSKYKSFARDCSVSICEGATVTYAAMQLAYHMGFTQVALVGCDHYFNSKGTANQTQTLSGNDTDHFDKSYFANSQWQLPDLLVSEVHYEYAKTIHEQYGRKIYNCTDGGHLEIFERKTLTEFLALQNPKK